MPNGGDGISVKKRVIFKEYQGAYMHFSKARKLLFLHELYFLWMLASMINTYSNSTITIHFCYLISISNILTSDI